MIMTLALFNDSKDILIPTIGFGIIAGKSEPEAASMKYTGKYRKEEQRPDRDRGI